MKPVKTKAPIDQSKLQAILNSQRFTSCAISYRCTGVSISKGYVAVKGTAKINKITVLFCGTLDEVEAAA